MKQIHITRQHGQVVFEDVSVDTSETVFFTNLDTETAHWPAIATNKLGPAPSPNSSECAVPVPSNNPSPPYDVSYACKLHAGETGVIHVFNQLAAGTTAFNGVVGQPLQPQLVVTGGKSPYTISGEVFQIVDNHGQIIHPQEQGSIGPGLQLQPQPNSGGIKLSGTPAVAGTYQFTFVVDDAMGRNLQQVQYSLQVSPSSTPLVA